MPPRPFPQTLSIGTDICHYPRFLKYFLPSTHHQKHLQNTSTNNKDNNNNNHNNATTTPLFKLFDKTFLPSEQRVFWRKFYPPLAGSRRAETGVWTPRQAHLAAQYLASRWAAKEAVVKAYAAERRLLLRDVEIRKDAKTKQPFGVVRDESEERRYEDAKEVLERLRRRWKVFEELERLQGQGESAGKGLRLEGKEDLPPQQEPTTGDSEPAAAAAAAAASASRTTPSIISEKGILDLNAVTKLLDQDPKTTTSPSPTNQSDQQHQQHPTDLPKHPKEPQSRLTQLEEEMKHLRKQEQAEDSFNNLQGQIVKLSISHDGEFCVATALAAV